MMLNRIAMRQTCEIASEFVSSKYSLALLRDPVEPTRFLPTIRSRIPNGDVKPRDDFAILALLPA